MSQSKIASTCVGSSQIAVKEPGTFQLTRDDLGFPEVAVAELGPYQIASSQVDTSQVDIVKLSAAQVNALQFDPTQVSVLQNDALKISLPSSITFEQLFYSNLFLFNNPETPSINILNNKR